MQYIEMALASGIILAKTRIKSLQTSTYVEALIKKAIENGAKKIIVGIGGSATNDGGTGMLEALGVKFFTNHHLLKRMNAQQLDLITAIDTVEFAKLTKHIEFIVLNDVKNPLLGTSGATYVYSKQKGSTSYDLPILEAKMNHYAIVCKQTLNCDYSSFPGTGAAGGLGFAFKTFNKAVFHKDGVCPKINEF